MIDVRPGVWIGDSRFDAVLFDLDGVVTDTARQHLAAWRQLWHEVLPELGADGFTDEDYRRHIDGRARIDGVASLLSARGVDLPIGEKGDGPDRWTQWGLAARKDERFRAALRDAGVAVIGPTVSVLRRLRAGGVPTGVVTASRNAAAVLAAAGLDGCFDVVVDGIVAEERFLPGKPDPAMFLEAARLLSVGPAAAVVIEDAVAGVRAAEVGGFGLVVGLGRIDRHAQLRDSGADVAVAELDELGVSLVDPGCALCQLPDDEWRLHFAGSAPEQEGTREALLALGNGYLGSRGAHPEVIDDGTHYPGSYIAGVFNRLTSTVDGSVRVDESMVNLPNWLPFSFRAQGEHWWGAHSGESRHEHRMLDMAQGLLAREAVVSDGHGRRTRVRQRRLVSMADPHRAALETTLIPENWSGRIEIYSGIDGRIRNRNVSSYEGLADEHIDVTGTGGDGTTRCWLTTETSQSRVRVTVAARTSVRQDGALTEVRRRVRTTAGAVGQDMTLAVGQGIPLTVDKLVSIFSSKDRAISEPEVAAREDVAGTYTFPTMLAAHSAAWEQLWRRFHVLLSGVDATRRPVNLHVFHLLQTLSVHTTDLDVGVPARGLHGEGYRGHIFWDELFVLPYLNFCLPELSRSLLLYRYRRLGQARRIAAELGCNGALFPWQSGSDGREETPRAFYNPLSDGWMADHSRLQYHVTLAVAHNVWHYWETTADVGFMMAYGAEMLIEIARFWVSIATYDSTSDRYDIRGVMGPDEFHDGYPGRAGQGIDNSSYVNVMVAWTLRRALDAHQLLGESHGSELWQRLHTTDAELAHWQYVATRLRLSFLDGGVLEQFEGYGELDELDWTRYRERYGNIGRLDLILESEDDDTNRYQVSKQADVLMLLYVFTAEELAELVRGLGYVFEPQSIPATVDYYVNRTSHGSTLSHVAHTWVLARTDRSRSWPMFRSALDADLRDTQGGTTREGIHLGAMAGTLDILQRCYTGLDVRCGVLSLHPLLPEELESLEFDLHYRSQWISVRVAHEAVTLCAAPSASAPVSVMIDGTEYQLAAGSSITVALDARGSGAAGTEVPRTRDLQQQPELEGSS
ncbi:HAD-IA family hydrolase [Haloechinothrix sp. LS1_15]|nr:HAD-IA family hydrolase [Haloechinothrix sp. LS1_15]